MEATKRLIGKKVFVILKNGRRFTGELKEVNDSGQMYLVDQYGGDVFFNESEISVLQEDKRPRFDGRQPQ